jgi:hypothetical protein
VVVRSGPVVQHWAVGSKSWKTLPAVGYKATGYYDSPTIAGRDPNRLYLTSCPDTADDVPPNFHMFDGTRWIRLTPPGNRCVDSVAESDDGTVWIVAADALHRDDPGEPRRWDPVRLPSVTLPGREAAWRPGSYGEPWRDYPAEPASEQVLTPYRVLAFGPDDIWVAATADPSRYREPYRRSVVLTTRASKSALVLPDDDLADLEAHAQEPEVIPTGRESACENIVLDLGETTDVPATTRPPALAAALTGDETDLRRLSSSPSTSAAVTACRPCGWPAAPIYRRATPSSPASPSACAALTRACACSAAPRSSPACCPELGGTRAHPRRSCGPTHSRVEHGASRLPRPAVELNRRAAAREVRAHTSTVPRLPGASASACSTPAVRPRGCAPRRSRARGWRAPPRPWGSCRRRSPRPGDRRAGLAAVSRGIRVVGSSLSRSTPGTPGHQEQVIDLQRRRDRRGHRVGVDVEDLPARGVDPEGVDHRRVSAGPQVLDQRAADLDDVADQPEVDRLGARGRHDHRRTSTSRHQPALTPEIPTAAARGRARPRPRRPRARPPARTS